MRFDEIHESGERGSPRKLKFTRTMEIASQLKNIPFVEKIVDMHSTGKGTVVMIRTDDGDAYEVEITPSYSGDYFQRQRGVEEDGEVGAGGRQATMKDKPDSYLKGKKLVGGG